MTPLPLDIVVKASALLGAAGLVHLVLRRRGSAAARHLLWTIAIAGLLVLPVASAALPHWRILIPVPRAAEPVQPRAIPEMPAAPGPVALHAPVPAGAVPLRARTTLPQWPVIALLLYALGVVILLGRLAREPFGLRRLSRGSRVVTDPLWRRLLADAAGHLSVVRTVRLLQSETEIMPMTFGTRHPAILLPASAGTWAEDRRRAVLLHELAHVARGDCLTQMLTAIACAIYWPHPGVWWAARRLRVERELACDDLVLDAGTDARDYAGHLLDIARSLGRRRVPVTALGMARARQLENRLLAVLDVARNRRDLAHRARVVAIAAGIAVCLPMAALRAAVVPFDVADLRGTAAPAVSAAAPAQPPSTSERPTGTWEIRPASEAGMVQLTMRTAHGSHGRSMSRAALEASAGMPIPESGPVHLTLRRDAGAFSVEGVCRAGVCGGTYEFEPSASFAGELAKRGLGTATAQDQLDMAVADVGIAYLDGLAAAGYKPPDVRALVRAAQHGVTLEYVRAMASLGYRLGTLDALVRLRDHGVDPAFVQGLASQGYARLPADDLVRARDHGVDPAYVTGMRDLGFGSATLDRMIAARDHGVDPAFVRGLAALGLNRLAPDELIRARDHGVDPAYVRGLADLGYKGIPLESLIRMRDHGVDPAYVQRLRDRGVKNLTVDELIERRDRGQDDPAVAPRALKPVSWQAVWQSLLAWKRG